MTIYANRAGWECGQLPSFCPKPEILPGILFCLGSDVSIDLVNRVLLGSPSTGSTKLVLVAIANYADKDGQAYPSVSTLARIANISVRQAGYCVQALQKSGEISVDVALGPHGCNIYHVTPLQPIAGVNPIAGLQPIAPPPCNTAPFTPATHCTQTISEPSVNHQLCTKPEKTPDFALDSGPVQIPKANGKTVHPVALDQENIQWSGISREDGEVWEEAFPAIDVHTELMKAAAWAVANPRQKKKNWKRFLFNWLQRAQERGSRFPRAAA